MLDLTTPAGQQRTFDWLHRLIGGAINLVGYAIGVTIWDPFIGMIISGALFILQIPVWDYKEFNWDLKNETPETSGGVKGGELDFQGYLEGSSVTVAGLIVFATLVHYLKGA